MPFLGSTPPANYKTLTKQTITGDSSTAYTLNEAVANANEIEVFVNNVRQQPTTDYTANNRTITFTDPLLSSDSCWLVYQGKAESTTLAQTSNIADGAVTMDKLASSGTLPALDGSALTGIESLPDAIDVNASAPADSLNIAANGSVTVKPNIAKATDTATLIAQIGTNDTSDPLALRFTARTGQGSNNYIAMDCAEGTTNRDFVVGYHSTEHFRIKADGRGLSQFTAKAWIKVNIGTGSISDSHNISSATNTETGQCLLSLSNSMPNSNYTAVASAPHFYSGRTACFDYTTGSFKVGNSSSSGYANTAEVAVIMFGD